MVNFATSSSSSSSDSSQSNVHLLFTSSGAFIRETLGKHVTGKFLTLAAHLLLLRNTTFISKDGIQFGASGRASVGRVGENRRVRGDWRDRGVERHLRWYVEHLICWGDFFPWGEKRMDRSLWSSSLSRLLLLNRLCCCLKRTKREN